MNVASPLVAARPYPGLRPFEAHEWGIFFGRERMIDEVIERLARDRLALIHGASGSGKSSLVRAGVMPKLARQHQRHGAPWLTCAMRPSGGPLWNLASEFARLEGRADDAERTAAILGLFNRRDATLASVAGSVAGLQGKSLCVLVDQFEELFRFEKETSREEAELFVDLIGRAAAPAGGEAPPDAVDIHVVVTMRSEFLGECARFDGLAETINRTQYLVPRMDDEGLVRAVRRPAQLFNGFVDGALAERLITSVRGREDELPLLQHGLMLMWDEAVRAGTGERVTLSGAIVEEAGGLAELLSQHADKVMDQVASDERQARIVETIFRELTDVNAEGSAIRRPRSLRDLATVAGATTEELRLIIDAFRAPGVSFLTPYAPAPLGENSIIDISHEALIRCWSRIASGQEGWLKREFDDGLAWRSLLVEADAFGKDRRRVLSAAAANERSKLFADRGESWSSRYGGRWPLVGSLLEASRKAAASARRRAMAGVVALAALSIGATVMAVRSFVLQQEAVAEKTRADQEKAKADHLEKEALAQKVMAEQENEVLKSFLYHITDSDKSRAQGKTFEQELFEITQPLAEKGNSTVEFFLAYCYHYGVGTPRDYTKAHEWYYKATLEGNTRAMRYIGILYEYGEGVPQDYVKARQWYEKAIAAGDATALRSMGLLYDNGHGVPQNYAKAREWYEKAAVAGDATAMRYIGDFYDNGQGVARDYAKAREWYEKAVAVGDVTAMRVIGVLYENGHGVAQDYAKAREWYERAAAAGDATAMRYIGVLYENAHGVSQDHAKAREWYEKAAVAGDATAMRYIGLLYENGHGLYEIGQGVARDYAKAREWYERAAVAGDATAMRYIGDFYDNGQGVARDYAKAREWYEKAVAAGDATAMRYIGDFYENGQGVSQDYAKAREWYDKAVAAGDTNALRYIGLLYENGHGVPQDYAKAREWYEKAAVAGDTPGMRKIGVLYENGHGVPQDYAKAREWYERAAAAGDGTAMRYIGDLYDNGQGAPQDFTKAREWYEKAAATGDAAAMADIGLLYENSQGVPQDFAKAHEWYEKAAAAGDANAMRYIGVLYENGHGVPEDYAKAREWYEKAAAAGDTPAMRKIGLLYENGHGAPQDFAKAREWYEKAAAAGDVTAMRYIGDLYDNGQGVSQDYAKAREWYEKAAAAGDAIAMRYIGVLYENGQGLPQDYAKAREWYEKAAAAGDTTGMRKIGLLYENGQGEPQDYAKAREWYEKAAAAGEAIAMRYVGDLYKNGQGVPKDYAKAREWYEKAVAAGDKDAANSLSDLQWAPKRDAVEVAKSSGSYKDALRLQEGLAAEIEADEVKSGGTPGGRTATELNGVSWYALFSREFPRALSAAERAHSLAPDKISYEANHAHALMFVGRTAEARALYLSYEGKSVAEMNNEPWRQVLADDFVELRKAGLDNPLMKDIEAALAAKTQ